MSRQKKSTEKLPPVAPVAASDSSTKKTAPATTSTRSAASQSPVDKPSPAATVASTSSRKQTDQPTITSTGSTVSSSQPTAASGQQSKKQTAAAAPVVPPPSHGVAYSPKTVDKTARKAKGARGFFKRAQTVVGLFAEAAEATRLQEDKDRTKNWKRWGPYLSERQWATVREDYSPDGSW